MNNQGRLIGLILSWFLPAFAYGAVDAPYVAGEFVVKLKPAVGAMSQQSMGTMMQSLDAEMKRVVSENSRTVVVKKTMLQQVDSVLEELKSHPMVEIAEPNYIYEASRTPDDAFLQDLWGLVNANKNNGGVDIDAEAAWDITTGSRDVVVAVIDTGVNYRDPDLRNNMWQNQAELNGQPGVDDDGNGYVDDIYGYDFANSDSDPMDDNDHGSHCAGTIGAQGNNGIGVVGVNWNVRIMALKFLKGQGGGTLEDALKAIDYATDKGVDIMNNSWGGGGYSENLKLAIERAEQAGILFVAAAGNNRNNNDSRPSYPASYQVPNVISVAAVDSRGRMASFSNYGRRSVHVAAPGVDILSTGVNGLKSLSGTSMASPHVAGVAALLLADAPGMNYQEIKARILGTSIPTNALRNKVSHGFINAYNALTNTLPPKNFDDPSQWDSRGESLSTDHPYLEDTNQSYTFRVPGASRVALHFDRFDLESGYDKVLFFDGSGNELGEMTGNHDDSYSPVASGDTIIVQFISDYSVNRYGFDVDRVHYDDEPRGDQWRSFRDPVSTAHPYENNLDEEVVFRQEGATEIRVKFSRFETEKNYDFVYFYDGSGHLLGKWDGNHDGEFSPTASGEQIILRIQSDYSVSRHGFDVEEVQYR